MARNGRLLGTLPIPAGSQPSDQTVDPQLQVEQPLAGRVVDRIRKRRRSTDDTQEHGNLNEVLGLAESESDST